MSTTVKAGWLKDSQGNKFAPKTIASQVMTNDGVTIESKLTSEVAQVEADIREYTDSQITKITDGTTIVAKATQAENATTATSAVSATTAEQATKDASGNVISDTYETKSDATAKLTDAKKYTEDIAATKADKDHNHDEVYCKIVDIENMVLITVDEIDEICGSNIMMASEVAL